MREAGAHGWSTGMSAAVVMVFGMRTRWSGATGRYQARCEQGHCALTGDQATSKLQGQIFTLVDYAIGPGHQDQRFYIGRRQTRLEMVFQMSGDRALVVEYDGAYWHQGHEERDFLEAPMVEQGWQERGCVVVRIREDPLTPLYLLTFRCLSAVMPEPVPDSSFFI